MTEKSRAERLWAKERGGCWHAVTAVDGTRWTAACGITGQPYRGRASSITRLILPPSPLHCEHPA